MKEIVYKNNNRRSEKRRRKRKGIKVDDFKANIFWQD